MSGTDSRPVEYQSRQVIDQLVAHTSPDMEAVNRLLLSRIGSHVDMVPEIASYLINAGGKRIRPMLTVAVAAMFAPVNSHHILYAAAVEFMHTATLLHDDVVDESDKRRGRAAPRKIWGNSASVLVGDFLLGQAFMMMVEAGNLDALEILSKAAAVIAEGEVSQLAMANNFNAGIDSYFEVIKAKTAALFEAATEVGALAANADNEQRKALKIYGAELGIAFQLVDDVLDYGGTTGAIGKNVGDDLREGKMTLPVLYALQNASEVEAHFIRRCLGQQGSDQSAVDRVIAIMQATGALETTLEHACAHARHAKAALEPYRDLNGADILIGVADYCVQRAE